MDKNGLLDEIVHFIRAIAAGGHDDSINRELARDLVAAVADLQAVEAQEESLAEGEYRGPGYPQLHVNGDGTRTFLPNPNVKITVEEMRAEHMRREASNYPGVVPAIMPMPGGQEGLRVFLSHGAVWGAVHPDERGVPIHPWTNLPAAMHEELRRQGEDRQ